MSFDHGLNGRDKIKQLLRSLHFLASHSLSMFHTRCQVLQLQLACSCWLFGQNHMISDDSRRQNPKSVNGTPKTPGTIHRAHLFICSAWLEGLAHESCRAGHRLCLKNMELYQSCDVFVRSGRFALANLSVWRNRCHRR